jgi:hypothetical protein
MILQIRQKSSQLLRKSLLRKLFVGDKLFVKLLKLVVALRVQQYVAQRNLTLCLIVLSLVNCLAQRFALLLPPLLILRLASIVGL